MVTLMEIHNDSAERLQNVRTIHRLITSNNFNKAYSIATDSQKEDVLLHIRNLNRFCISQWIRKILGLKTIYELRNEAKIIKMPNYTRMKTYKIDKTKEGINLQNEYLRAIKRVHKDLAEYIIKSGIQKEKYNFLIKDLEKKSLHHILQVYVFLIDLKDNEYKEIKRVYNLVPEHVWKNYETIFNTNEMPEQEHLQKARKAVKEKWSSRPKEKVTKRKEEV